MSDGETQLHQGIVALPAITANSGTVNTPDTLWRVTQHSLIKMTTDRQHLYSLQRQ